jgi:fructosamine-3-kinase
MRVPSEVSAWLEERGHGAVTAARPAGGGCINNGVRLTTETGAAFFLKTNAAAPPGMFIREAEGLAALRVEGAPRVPEVFLAGADFLLLEDLAPAAPRRDYWEALGRQLAALHGHTSPRFGFEHDNYIGLTPQANAWTDDGHAFFAERRLMAQARRARDARLLGVDEVRDVERLARRLAGIIPAQPASLLHGDLWAGNAISDTTGNPALIDPAAHYGWAEAELGMTALFGGFPAAFYAAYEEARPLAPGWRARLPVYNLYHLLNHLNLFGAGYHGQAMAALRAGLRV